MKQKTMKANDADFSEGSQREFRVDELEQAARRELSAGVLKQAAQDLRRFRRRNEQDRARTLPRCLSLAHSE